jgi:phosphopantetheinyl transferase (holo-ACP synthase)
MNFCRTVCPGLVLAVHREAAGRRGRERRVIDQRSSRLALTAALSHHTWKPTPSFSLSHTEGIGAALVGPEPLAFGVDLVRAERVNERHARAITTKDEWSRMAGRVAPALVWGLKEATAKATGQPERFWGTTLRIMRARSGRWEIVTEPECSVRRFAGRWLWLGEYLLVWVWDAEAIPAVIPRPCDI